MPTLAAPRYRLTNLLSVPQRLEYLEIALHGDAISAFQLEDGFVYGADLDGTPLELTVNVQMNAMDVGGLDLTVPAGASVVLSTELMFEMVRDIPGEVPSLQPGTQIIDVDAGTQTPYAQVAWSVHFVDMLNGDAEQLSLTVGLGSKVTAGAGERELRPELLPGFRAAAEGTTPVKRASDVTWEKPAVAGGPSALTGLPVTALDDSPDWTDVGFGGWEGFTWDTMQYADSLYSYGHTADGELTGGSRIGVTFTVTQPTRLAQLRVYCDTYEYPTVYNVAQVAGLGGLRAVVLDATGTVRLDTKGGFLKFGEYGYSTPGELYAQFVQWGRLTNPLGQWARLEFEPGEYQLILYSAGGAIDPFVQSSAAFTPRGLSNLTTRVGEFDGVHEAAITRMTDENSTVIDGYQLMFALGWLSEPARTYAFEAGDIDEGLPLGLTYDHRVGRMSFEGDGNAVDVLGQEVVPGTESLIGNRRLARLSATPHEPLIITAAAERDLGLQSAVAFFLAPSRPLTLGGLSISAALADEVRAALAAHPDTGTNFNAYMELRATLYDVTNALWTRQGGYLLDGHQGLSIGVVKLPLTDGVGQRQGAAVATGTPMELQLNVRGRDVWLAEERQYVLALHVYAPYHDPAHGAIPALIPLRVGSSTDEGYAAGHGHLVSAQGLNPSVTTARGAAGASGAIEHVSDVSTGEWVADHAITLLVGGGAGRDVYGRLSPEAFPRSTAADAPNGSGFMLVDDQAKTAALVWKFSDGTTKQLDLI